ncbi:MAG TPA: hypothetical protein VF363_00235 [Candidatus Eisenbacteria bacterium]
MGADRRGPSALRTAARAAARAAAVLVPLALAGSLPGCVRAPESGAPRVALGTPCATCGMEVRDLRYACASRRGGTVRVYDSIECALRGGAESAAAVYVADFDTGGLHAADSLWVVRADLPTPMGGGYVAFLDRRPADRVAAARAGRVGRLRDFLAETPDARR